MVVVVVVLVSLYPWSGRPRVSSVENVHILCMALKFRLSIGGHAALARAGIPISFYYVIQKDINHNEGINQCCLNASLLGMEGRKSSWILKEGFSIFHASVCTSIF